MKKKEKKMRIIMNTNAPWGISGYSQQAAELLPRIRAEGYPTACIAFYGLEGGLLELDDILYYPKIDQIYGSDALVLHGQDFGADVTFTHQDVHTLNLQDLRNVRRWIPIVPIDHEPAPKHVVDRLRMAYRIITYSMFGHRQLRNQGLNSTYIQCTVDTTLFQPFAKKEERDALRETIGVKPYEFLFGMVSANKENPPRKSFQEVLDAFKKLHDENPNVKLYVHTNTHIPEGFPVHEYAKFLGIGDKVLLPDVYQMRFKLSKNQMPMIYQCMDCLLAPSVNEGFGLPIIEAQSCGVPVITNNITSMPELVRDGVTGYICDVGYKRFSPQRAYVGVPAVESLYEKMVEILKKKEGEYDKMSKEARRFIIEEYDSDLIFKKKWIPFLRGLEEEIVVQ